MGSTAGETSRLFEPQYKKVENKSFILRRTGGRYASISPSGEKVITGGNLWDALTGEFIAFLKNPETDSYVNPFKNRMYKNFIKRLNPKDGKYFFIEYETGRHLTNRMICYSGMVKMENLSEG